MDSKNSSRTRAAASTPNRNASWATRNKGAKLVSVPNVIASHKSIPQDQRRKLIAEAAYLKAERRGFRGGSPERDWLDAEAEVDANLLREARGTR